MSNTETQITVGEVNICLTPCLYISGNINFVPTSFIDMFKEYHQEDPNNSNSYKHVFTHIPILIKHADTKYELLQNRHFWNPELSRIQCSHILSFVMADNINEIDAQTIRDYLYHIDGARSTVSRDVLLEATYNNNLIYNTLKTGYETSSSALKTSTILDLYGPAIGSESTINRTKKKHHKTQTRTSVKKEVLSLEEGIELWNQHALSKNIHLYDDLYKLLNPLGAAYTKRFNSRVTDPKQDFNVTYTRIIEALKKAGVEGLVGE